MISAPRAAVLPGRKYDRVFFSAMVLIILIIVAVGFAPKYYLAGVFRAPLPNLIIHIHAAVYTAWILLLVAQTGLVAARRVTLHRTLGVAGFLLAILVPIAGFLAMASQLHFKANVPGRDTLGFSAISFEGILIFTIFIIPAYLSRKRDLAAHKRYILLATLGLIDAGLFRMPIPFVHRNVNHDFLVIDALIVLMALYDLWSTHKIYRSTLWGGLTLILIEHVTIPVGNTPIWHAFARYLRSWQL